MGIQINGQTDTISASDGGLSVSGYELTGASNINVTGIVTATGLDVTNIKHPSFGSNTFVLDSSGNINIDSGGVYYDASNNRFGVGTASPGETLDVVGQIRTTNTTAGSGLVVKRSDSVNASGALNFTGSDDTVDASVRMASDAADALTFQTAGVERMRIRNDGNVGIANNGNDNVRLFVNAPVSDSNNWSIFGNNAAGTNAFGVRGDGAIYCGLLSLSPYNLTTAGAANAVLMSDGYFYRSTSSAKYKKDIETIDYAYSEALLNCRPVWYRSTSNADNPEWGWWGFIAEEVASIDPRLVHWKTTEPVAQENGTPKHAPCEPEPEGVAYDRFVPHLLNLIKRQKERIETLETQNASFEARLTALEGGQP